MRAAAEGRVPEAMERPDRATDFGKKTRDRNLVRPLESTRNAEHMQGRQKCLIAKFTDKGGRILKENPLI
jgi:hypothetical protein